MDTQSAASALWNAAHHHGRNGLELEFRLGRMVDKSFVSNIGQQNFNACQQYLEARCCSKLRIHTTETVRGDTKHVVTHAYHIDSSDGIDPARGVEGQRWATPTRHHNPSGDPAPPPPPYTMTKKKLFHTEFPSEPFTIRASIAVEDRLLLTTQLPPGKGRVITREKRRTRYIWGPWAYDLTVVVSNADLDSEETYELELELLDTMALFEHTMDHLLQWGLQLAASIVSSSLQN